MTAQGEALSRSGCHAAGGRGRVIRGFILLQILPPEAPRPCRVYRHCLVASPVKPRAINSFMISLAPP